MVSLALGDVWLGSNKIGAVIGIHCCGIPTSTYKALEAGQEGDGGEVRSNFNVHSLGG